MSALFKSRNPLSFSDFLTFVILFGFSLTLTYPDDGSEDVVEGEVIEDE